MNYKELERKLKKAGCYYIDDGTNHANWYSPKTGLRFQVPRHGRQEVPTGTCNRILKDAGLK